MAAGEFDRFDIEAVTGDVGHQARAQGAVITGQQVGRREPGGGLAGGFGVGPGEVGELHCPPVAGCEHASGAPSPCPRMPMGGQAAGGGPGEAAFDEEKKLSTRFRGRSVLLRLMGTRDVQLMGSTAPV